jgi:hypothetical protein
MSDKGNGLQFRDLLKTSRSASYYWGDIPLLLVIGDHRGMLASDLFVRPALDHATRLMELSLKIEIDESYMDALLTPIVCKSVAGDDGPVLVGRSNVADICLNHTSVSKQHAQFLPPDKPGGLWRLQDLKSRNGTVVNGMRLDPEPVTARFMDGITFGSVRCRLLDSDAVDDLVASICSGDPDMETRTSFKLPKREEKAADPSDPTKRDPSPPR